MNDFKNEENNESMEEKTVEKTEPLKSQINITKNMLIIVVIVTILTSSIFGAFFGFISAGVMNIFSSKISKKVEQYFPNSQATQDVKKVDKQQVIVEDSAVIDVVEKTSPSVVSIIISKNVSRNFNVNPFDIFGGGNVGQNDQGAKKQQVGGGSGFFISADGYIVTNRHVVDDTQAEYTVMTSDLKEYPAKVLARDPIRDVAIIKIEGNDFPVMNLGDSDSIKIGQTVVAIGNSLGEFTNSVSRGIISGLKRNLSAAGGGGDTERLTDIVQTDAAINPGNSGGPLLDINGNVIGVNVAIAQGAQNVGFALPINQAKRLIEQVKTGKQISVPYLGVRYVNIDSAIQKEAQLPFNYGVLVLRGSKMTDLAIIPGSPADKADIVENDIILEMDGVKIDDNNQLGDLISKHNAGDIATLKIWHKGQMKDVKVTLEEKKQ
jgi:serine protease Do